MSALQYAVSDTIVLAYRVAGFEKWVCSSSHEPGPGALNSIDDMAFFSVELAELSGHTTTQRIAAGAHSIMP